jgi:hypothetical protein
MNTAITAQETKTPAPRLAAMEQARKASWWAYINACCNNRRTQSRPSVLQKSAVGPGMVLEATDCRYVVNANGSWRRVERANEIPAHKSQIRLLPEPSRNKY